ncbi:MAG: GxxExxY protein [Ferruginibacter sp.]
MEYQNNHYLLSAETSKIIGLGMEVHRNLGRGFSEIVYKDAIEYELLKGSISYEREREYNITYKDIILRHKFYADFVIFNTVILEIKAQRKVDDAHYAQTINYLAASKCKVGLILNFGENSLIYKRVIL